MTNSYDVDHGLSQDAPGPLEPVEVAKVPACLTCNDQGAVGNILTAEPCPACAAPGVSTVEDQAKPNGQNVGQIVDEYIQEYELRGEDEEGRDGVYSPNETERYMIADAIYGLLAEPEFIVAIAGMRPAPAAGDAQVLEFVREVAQQKPEKPDYWSSCGQCGSNSRRAEELLDELAAQRKGDA